MSGLVARPVRHAGRAGGAQPPGRQPAGRRGRGAADRGAAAVEMALVLPMLLMVIFGIIDFGRLLHAQITVTEAAREGARAAALKGDVTSRVAALTGSLDSASATAVRACPATADPSRDAEVTVSLQFEFITPVGALAGLFGPELDDPITVTGRGVMPCMQ